MERPTTEVKLPISGKKAVVYAYYTRGERKAIEAIMLESAVFEQVGDSPKLKSVDASYRSKMEDKAVLLAVKHFLGKNEEVIKTEQSVIDEIPEEDFELLQKSLPGNKATEVKKK